MYTIGEHIVSKTVCCNVDIFPGLT
jgi:hypothetical protein